MFRPLARSHRRPPRKGTSFTLIAVSMLTLFAAVGMGYALYAHTIAKQTQSNAEAQGKGAAPAIELPDPTGTMNRFLGALTYGVPYDRTGAEPNAYTNALRGHEPVRSIYGYDLAALNAGVPITAPFAGVGTFHEPNPQGDRGRQVNHTLVMINGQPFLLDPEYTGTRNVTASTPVPPLDPNARNYVNKAAGYSYPDLKDFFAAVVDPVTGQVLVPSFHRELLFGSLDPNNLSWTSANGALLTLRPRPAEHPNFPQVPRNADGSFTGDVQNLPGGVGPQRNDSLWMDVGAPAFTWSNRRIKPLVAPLIVPLNGLLNASAHGRNRVASHSGFGPWEVNLPLALANNGALVVDTRGVPQQRSGVNQRQFAPTQGGALPTYAPVAWRAAPAMPAAYPAGGDLSGLPNFGGLETDNTVVPSHASLFNANQWPSTGPTRTFALTDVKRLQSRYAFMRNFYQEGDLPPVAPNDLLGVQQFIIAPGQTQAHAWRIDSAHANKLLVTPFGFDLQRPKVAPQHLRGALALPANAFKPLNPEHGRPYPPAGSPVAAGADFAGANRWTNALAALGCVDLNRQLTDYRADRAAPLSATNFDPTNAAQAEADRQALARDIFVRLIASTGGAATINTANGTYTVTAAPASPEYNALRYLAQVAANAVDYVDNDDISTPFPWDPNVRTEIVYGVEKPRLLINEARGEIVNDPRDPVSDPDPVTNINRALPGAALAHVRFWFELLNPGANPPAGAPIPGPVDLTKYRIEVARANRSVGAAAPQALSAALADPTNTVGAFGGRPDLAFSFPANLGITSVAPNNGAYAPAAPLPNSGIVLVGPEVQNPKPNEFAPPTAAGNTWESGTNALIVPGAAPAPGANALAYTLPMPTGAELQSREFREHVVLLRRAANPYLRPNDPAVTDGPYPFDASAPQNPYVTVDLMEHVPAFDGVHRDQGASNPRVPRPPANPMGANREYDPEDQRFSVGKVQPFAGHAQLANAAANNGPGNYNQYTFPQSMVLAQTARRGAGTSGETFGRHNGNAGPPAATTVAGNPPTLTDTIMAPFDWFVHMDRPLINQTELFHVRDTAAHYVTDRFLRLGANNLPDYEFGVGQWRASAGLARALEFLTVRPYTVGVPHGGRDPGRINPNAVQDERVLLAQFDPQAGNTFNAAFVQNTVWGQWMNTRSGLGTRTAANGAVLPTAGAPGTSNYDANVGGNNRPFFSLGAPAVAPGSPFAFGAGGSENDTVLRRDAQPLPFLFNTAAAGPAGSYFQAEPLRKTFNTTTTVNHQYAVFFTIGYFEVGPHPNPNFYQNWPTNVPVPEAIGAEVFREVPGDMRQKYASVIDLSALALDPVANAPASATPFFTTLETTARPSGTGRDRLALTVSRADATAVYVPADGTEVPVQAGSTLVLGYGADQQVVQVVALLGGGSVEVTGLTRPAWGGSCVSNVRPGYAGPQSGFNVADPRFRPVVPYVERLR